MVETERKTECSVLRGVADTSVGASVAWGGGRGCLSEATGDKVMEVLTTDP